MLIIVKPMVRTTGMLSYKVGQVEKRPSQYAVMSITTVTTVNVVMRWSLHCTAYMANIYKSQARLPNLHRIYILPMRSRSDDLTSLQFKIHFHDIGALPSNVRNQVSNGFRK